MNRSGMFSKRRPSVAGSAVMLCCALLIAACDAVEPEGAAVPYVRSTPAGVKTYGLEDTDDLISNLAVLPDGRLLFGYNSWREFGYQPSPSRGSACVGLDANGRQLWVLPASTESGKLNGLHLSASGSTIAYYDYKGLVALSSTGGILWTRKLRSNQLSYVRDAVQLADGRIAVAGAMSGYVGRVLILDPVDTSIVRTVLLPTTDNRVSPLGLADAGNGSLIVAGTDDPYGTENAYIARIDAATLTVTRFPTDDNERRVIQCLSGVRDGAFYTLAVEQSWTEDTWYLKRWSVAGNALWERTLENKNGVVSIYATADGGVLLCGTRDTDGGSYGFVRKLDAAQGALLWEHKINSPAVYDTHGQPLIQFNTFVDRIVEQTDGRIVLAGRSDGWGSGRLDVFLMRIDPVKGIDTTFGR